MTPTDRLLQRWRISKVAPFIRPGDRVLDLGSADGVLFERVRNCGPGSLGIDPTIPVSTRTSQGLQLIRGRFPNDLPADASNFDVIAMLAVLEHFPPGQYTFLAEACARLLKPGGKLVITVPSPAVDVVLKLLLMLRLVHGMSLEEHHGYRVEQTSYIFAEPFFRLLHRKRFQLGLNNLFVFQRVDEAFASHADTSASKARVNDVAN